MNIQCGACSQWMTLPPQLIGRAVNCPHCRQLVQTSLPTTTHASAVPSRIEVLPPEPAVPQIVVRTSGGGYSTRLKPQGWFANAFASTAGVLIACGLIVFAGCAGLYYATLWQVSDIGRNVEKHFEDENAKAKKLATPIMAKLGYPVVSNDTAFSFYTEGGADRSIVGSCKDRAGKQHHFSIDFKVATFGDKEEWEHVRTIVDGERLSGAKTSSEELDESFRESEKALQDAIKNLSQ